MLFDDESCSFTTRRIANWFLQFHWERVHDSAFPGKDEFAGKSDFRTVIRTTRARMVAETQGKFPASLVEAGTSPSPEGWHVWRPLESGRVEKAQGKLYSPRFSIILPVGCGRRGCK